MITPKQRALLRSRANTIKPTVFIGKDGMTDAVTRSAWDALEAHELVKVSVLRAAPYETSRAACDAFCEATHAEPVQCIGGKFVVYREAREDPKLLRELERGEVTEGVLRRRD